MKSTELRRLNLVEYDGCIFEIDTIAEEFPTLNTMEFGIGVVGWENIKPITLTEEWLLKFCFKVRFKNEDLNKPVFLRSEKNRQIDIYPHDEYNFYFMINEIQMSIPLLFVHQLQNLYFALTGEELTINK